MAAKNQRESGNRSRRHDHGYGKAVSRSRWMGKMAVSMALVLTAVTVLAGGCGKDGQGAQGKEITISTFDGNPYAPEEFAKVVEQFQEDHPGVTVEVQHAPNDNKALLQSRVNSGEIPDVFAVEAGSFAEMYYEYAYDWSEDTDILELFHETAVDRGRDGEGRVMALPWFYENMGMLYNKDCFEKAGITKLPVNVQELEEACKKLEEKGITAFALGGKETWVLSQLASHFILDKSLDGEGTNEALLKGDLTIAGLPHMDNLFKLLDLAVAYGPDKPLEIDWETSENMFANGEAAMIQMGDWCQATLDSFNPDARVGFLPMPVGDTEEETTVLSSGNWVLIVNKDSQNLELAKEYLVYILTSQKGVEWICNHVGLVPCAKTDTQVQGMLANDAKTYIEAGRTNGWLHTIAPATYSETCGACIQAYMTGGMTKDEVIQSLQEIWDAQ